MRPRGTPPTDGDTPTEEAPTRPSGRPSPEGAEREVGEALRVLALLRAVVDSSPDWIFVKDLDYRFLLVNRAFAASQGVEPQSMVGHLDSEFWSREECEGDEHAGTRGYHHDDRAAFRGELVRNSEDHATAKDGVPRVFDTFKGPLRDADGQIYGVVGVARDITELRRAERNLRESEQRFRALFEQAAVGVALIETRTGRFLRINRKYVEIIGYGEDEMLGLDFMRISHADDLADDLALMGRLERGEIREFAMEKRLVRKDGAAIWVALSVSPMWSPGEEPTQHIAVVQDISERRAVEARSEQHRVDLESTLAALPDLMFDIDDEGRIHDFRAPTPELLVMPGAKFLGQTVDEVLPPDVARTIHEAIRETLVKGRAGGFRYKLLAGGRDRWFEISLAQKRVASARARMIAIARDVTDQVAAEEQRRSLEAQLRQAQKMEAIGTLAGGIAHDFNNLLAMIGLNASSARLDLEAGHPALESLEAVATVVARGEKLVQQLLAFSRRKSASRASISLNEAVLDASKLLRATVPAGIKLVVTLAEEAPRALADAAQLSQVLINLGNNAWQAIESGHGTIQFEVARVVFDRPETLRGLGADGPIGPGDFARLRVRDDGVGMTPEVVARIFEPFFTTKGPGKGSGLGLSVVHGIVEEHGGRIAVESSPGGGTSFDVYLACLDDAAPASVKVREVARGTGARVLHVDDEPMMVRPVQRMLDQLGYHGRGFSDPLAALEAFRAEPAAYDVLVTDLTMPGMSGLELAREVTRIRAIPVVLVSGYAPVLGEDLEPLGVRQLLGKPFDAGALSRALRAALAKE